MRDRVVPLFALLVLTGCGGQTFDYPDPSQFKTSSCGAGLVPGKESVLVNGGPEHFDELAQDSGLSIRQTEKGESVVYFSVRVLGLNAKKVCLIYRMDVTDPAQPAEAVSFDRRELDFTELSDGWSQFVGIPAVVQRPDLVKDRAVRLNVQALDQDGRSGAAIADTVVH